MARQHLTHRAPSGDILDLDWDGAAPGSQVSGVRFAGGSYGRGFQVHPLGAHEFAITHFTPGARTERLVVGRNEVRVAVDGTSTTATLLGSHHELMTVFTGPPPTSARIVDLFGVLDIDDAAEGMRVTPSRSSLLSVMNEHHVVVVDDFISMDMPGPAHARRMAPGHRGSRNARGNEVWKSELPGRGLGRGSNNGNNGNGNGRARDFAYIVGSRTGVAEIIASDPEATTDDAVMTLVDSLDVAWSAGR
ncbi:MAG: hypothetical protein Q4G43_08910 [Mobilicoccus sp.]|nr:hypothetical protein [Mobilicoccus sp.]